MTIGLLLTAVFVVLQLTGHIDWEWWQIVMPSFIEIGFGVVAFVIWVVFVGSIGRRF